MNGAALFSPADIRVIRSYVQTKYAHLSGAKRAEIVASAVKMTVQRRMPELPADLQSQVADKLIRRCLVEAQRAIVPTDVLDVCSSLALPDPQTKARVASAVLSWMKKHAPGQWDERKLADRMGELVAIQSDNAGNRAVQSRSIENPGTGVHTGDAGNENRDVQQTAVVVSELAAPEPKTSAAGSESRKVQVTERDESALALAHVAAGASAYSDSGANAAEISPQGQARLSTDDDCLSMEAFAGDLVHERRGFTGLAAVPKFVWALAIMLLFGGITAAAMAERKPPPEPVHLVVSTFTPSPVTPPPEPDIGMPAMLRYREIDREAIQEYLNSRDSILAQEPYFSAIVDSGREHDVHPLLLFAITGQEQGFVPKTNKHAERIANNPFNVFQSWERFNTNIHESADIAARTVSRRVAKRPEGVDPFAWLNETYAEDPNWAQGVKLIFTKLNSLERESVQAMANDDQER